MLKHHVEKLKRKFAELSKGNLFDLTLKPSNLTLKPVYFILWYLPVCLILVGVDHGPLLGGNTASKPFELLFVGKLTSRGLKKSIVLLF